MDYEQPTNDQPKFLRALPSTANLLEGQFGQPVHNIVTNALRKNTHQQQQQQPKQSENKKK